MKNNLTFTLFAFVVSCAFHSFSTAAENAQGNPELLRLKSTYENEITKLDDSDMAAIVSEQEKYLLSLANIKKKAQEAGKLETLLLINKEIERFTAEKKIDAEGISKDIPDLATAQNTYVKALGRLPPGKAGKLVALTKNYEKALTTLQENLTKSNDINSAVQAKNEKERLANVPELISARALLAEAETKAAADKTPAKPINKETSKIAPVEDAPAKKKYTGTPEKRIRQRFDDLCKVLLKQDMTKAAEFVAPELAKELGDGGIRRCFSGIFPFLQYTDDPRRKLSIDSVKIGENKETATLIPKLWSANKWHELPSNKWVEFEGEWYIDITGGDEQRMSHQEKRELIEPGRQRPFPGKPFRR